jgi:hypothetical protein
MAALAEYIESNPAVIPTLLRTQPGLPIEVKVYIENLNAQVIDNRGGDFKQGNAHIGPLHKRSIL